MGIERARNASDLLPSRPQGGPSWGEALRRRPAPLEQRAVGRYLARARRRHRHRAGQHGRARDHPRRPDQRRLHRARDDRLRGVQASVEPWTLEEGERVTGVPAETIRELAHAYARADRAILCWTLGITEHVTAVDNVLSLINLSLLTGHVGRYGSGLNPLRGQNNVQGGGDMGAIPNKLPGFQDIEKNEEARARFEVKWGTPIIPKYGWHLTQMFEGMERGELKTLYVIGENPAQSEADSKKTQELLEGLDFLIVQDILRTKTADMADVVLPATASWCEVDGGTVTNSERRVQRMRKALDPARPGPRRSLDHLRARPAARSRLGPPHPRRCLERVAHAEPDAHGHELPAARGDGRDPMAVPERGPPRLALPPLSPVGRPARTGTEGAVLDHHLGATDRRVERRVPDAADHGPAPGLLQHGSPVRISTARRCAGARRSTSTRRTRRTCEVEPGEIVKISSRRGSVEAPVRPGHELAARPGLHDVPLPRPGRRQRTDDRRHRSEVGDRGVQGDGRPRGEAERRTPRRQPGSSVARPASRFLK